MAKFGNGKVVNPMESQLTADLARCARHIGLSVHSAEFDRAVETGLTALAEGHAYDVAVEVARSVLPQPVAV